MKQLIVKIFIFILSIYLIDKPIGFLISKGIQLKQFDNRIERLEKNQLNQELFIIGSSRAVNDISPEVIFRNTGKTAYNLGYSGSNINFHKSICNLIIAQHKPQGIVLTLDGDQTFINNERGIYRKDKFQPYLQYKSVLEEYVLNSSKDYWASKFCWVYRENQSVFEALEYLKNGQDAPDETTNINQHGAIFLPVSESHVNDTSTSNKKRTSNYDRSTEVKKYLQSFEDIISTCLSNNIQLYIVITPNYMSTSKGFQARIKELVRDRFPILDFSNSIQEKEFYFDNSHLNKNGALKLSNLISKHL